MAQVINTNVMSLNAQRNLTTSGGALATTLQRLSSGLRINSAKDDAAGLAISERFTTQIRGLNQAVRNANDAISLSQTAEGALGEYSNVLQRVRELSVQAANSTNSSSDRAAINSEAQQMLAEMSRISTTTQFNGQSVLDGSFTSAQFQVGANANQTISVSIGNASTTALGAYQYNNSSSPVGGVALASGDLTINGVNVGTSATGSAEDMVRAINGVTGQTAVTATAVSTLSATNSAQRGASLQSGDLVINGVNIGVVTGSNDLSTQGANLVTAINNRSASTGVTATANAVSGVVSLTSTSGKTIAVTSANGNAGANRVENATGLEVAGNTATRSTNTVTFANGVLGRSSVNITTNAQVGDTLTVGGTTYSFIVNGGTETGNQIALGANAGATNDAILARLTTLGVANATVAQGGGAGTAVTVTSTIMTATTSHYAMTYTPGGSGVATVNNAVIAGAGAAVGDQVTVGGQTYEFVMPAGTASGANIAVALGATDSATATNFGNAVTARYAAVASNVQVNTVVGGVVTLRSDLYGSTALTGTEPTSTGTANAVVIGAGTAGTDGTYAASTTYGTISLNSNAAYQVGGTNPSKAGLSTASATLTSISTIDISSVTGANTAINLVDGALAQISKIRADLGAVQNRFESTIANQSAISENLSAARSRIRDADYASETSMLTRAQILQQAGTAILSQANSVPQSVLSLLR
jgi:flagellin